MMYIFLIAFVLLNVFFNSIFSAQLLISQPGQYRIGQSISYTPVASDAIIKINTSNVILDLNNYILQQSGGTGTLNGIEITSGLSNIIIKNAVIKNISGTAVLVGQNCNNISLENIQTFTINRGIWFVGNSKNCRLSNITVRFSTREGIYTSTQVNNVILDTALLDSCGSSGIFVEGTTSQRTIANTIKNVVITQTPIGINLSSADNCLLNNCRVLQFPANTIQEQYGLLISGVSGTPAKGNIIQNCIVENIGINSPAVAIGFSFQEVSGSLVRNCIVKMNSNQTANAYGFQVASAVNGNTIGVVFDACNAFGMTGSSIGYGFNLTGVRSALLKNCQIFSSLQTSGNGSSDNFYVVNGFFNTLKFCKSVFANSSDLHVAGGVGHILNNCMATGNNRNGFFCENATNPLLDSCITCTVSGAGFGNGYLMNNITAGLIFNSEALGCTSSGFVLDASGANTAFENCTASRCVTGFNNSNNTAIFYNNVATNCSTTGFLKSGAISTARYFLNEATNNATNYSAIIPNQVAQGGAERQGGNLSI